MREELPSLLSAGREQLADWLRSVGEPRWRAAQIQDWLRKGVLVPEMMTNLPKALRSKLAECWRCAPLRLVQRSDAKDGVRKYLFAIADGPRAGKRIEAVFIPERDRGTLCISSQIGCVLSCPFCRTGTMRFAGNLDAAEILAQVAEVRRDLALDPLPAPWRSEITHIVFMGMGEPLANEEAVHQALSRLLAEDGFRISRRRITVSTAGIVPKIERLGARYPVNLAVSLHAARDALRDELVPINRKWNLEALRRALSAYPLGKQRHITLEYVLLEGVNDTEEEIAALLAFADPRRERVNLIPFNPWPGAPYRPTPMERAHAIAAWLVRRGLRATVRRPRGQDTLAACGQLAVEAAQ